MLLHTYAKGQSLKLLKFHTKDGVTDIASLKELMDEDTAAVLVQYPNFFGQIEDIKKIGEIAHEKRNHYLLFHSNPLALGVLNTSR